MDPLPQKKAVQAEADHRAQNAARGRREKRGVRRKAGDSASGPGATAVPAPGAAAAAPSPAPVLPPPLPRSPSPSPSPPPERAAEPTPYISDVRTVLNQVYLSISGALNADSIIEDEPMPSRRGASRLSRPQQRSAAAVRRGLEHRNAAAHERKHERRRTADGNAVAARAVGATPADAKPRKQVIKLIKDGKSCGGFRRLRRKVTEALASVTTSVSDASSEAYARFCDSSPVRLYISCCPLQVRHLALRIALVLVLATLALCIYLSSGGSSEVKFVGPSATAWSAVEPATGPTSVIGKRRVNAVLRRTDVESARVLASLRQTHSERLSEQGRRRTLQKMPSSPRSVSSMPSGSKRSGRATRHGNSLGSGGSDSTFRGRRYESAVERDLEREYLETLFEGGEDKYQTEQWSKMMKMYNELSERYAEVPDLEAALEEADPMSRLALMMQLQYLADSNQR